MDRGSCKSRSEEHTSELQLRLHLVCRLLLEKKKGAGRPPWSAAAPAASAPGGKGGEPAFPPPRRIRPFCSATRAAAVVRRDKRRRRPELPRFQRVPRRQSSTAISRPPWTYPFLSISRSAAAER